MWVINIRGERGRGGGSKVGGHHDLIAIILRIFREKIWFGLATNVLESQF